MVLFEGTYLEVDKISNAIGKLDAWFETMRGPRGYGGPVTHWWESNLLYCGPKIDWRYEGIIIGYLNLFDITGDQFWLDRAVKAAEDVRKAQMPSGNYLNSSFQQGPIEGGTPHEAAVNVSMLELAFRLQQKGDTRWRNYLEIAWRNLHDFQIERLWNGRAFLDQPWNQTLVANKNATTLEALILHQELSHDDMGVYIKPTAEFIMKAQVTDHTRPYYGGVVHLGTGQYRLVIGIYTARCVSALIRLYKVLPEKRYLESAIAMGRYLLKLITANGTHFGHYPDGRVITHPTWISPNGDILRALVLLQPYVDFVETPIVQLIDILLSSQQPTGGIPTSLGIARKGATGPVNIKYPDFRDVLPVVGWCDKAFRALTMLPNTFVKKENLIHGNTTKEICSFFKHIAHYFESKEVISVNSVKKNMCLYSYTKKNQFADTFLRA
ncbi:MAG: hypothetical protein JW973_12015 [Bacteroidales bacterium]|nr:hypothetical protein [Bacteroidales bacterium]